MNKVPYSDLIDWEHPRPWGGGSADARSVRIYYGTHSPLVVTCPKLTRPDVAWCMVDYHESPENYDWSFLVGHDAWLYPVGFKTAPYSRKLTEALKANHVHRVMQVQGISAEVLALIEKGDVDMVTCGPVKGMYRHEMLPAGTV